MADGGQASVPWRLARSVIDSVGPAGAKFARNGAEYERRRNCVGSARVGAPIVRFCAPMGRWVRRPASRQSSAWSSLGGHAAVRLAWLAATARTKQIPAARSLLLVRPSSAKKPADQPGHKSGDQQPGAQFGFGQAGDIAVAGGPPAGGQVQTKVVHHPLLGLRSDHGED